MESSDEVPMDILTYIYELRFHHLSLRWLRVLAVRILGKNPRAQALGSMCFYRTCVNMRSFVIQLLQVNTSCLFPESHFCHFLNSSFTYRGRRVLGGTNLNQLNSIGAPFVFPKGTFCVSCGFTTHIKYPFSLAHAGSL